VEPQSLNAALQIVVGKQLSSVTFVLDYWRLEFEGNNISVMTWLCVNGDGQSVRSGEEGFRNRLCERIGKIVDRADFSGDILTIGFDDGYSIRAFARFEDYRGPEALLFQSYSFKTLFVV
jgi:hypothetical protein